MEEKKKDEDVKEAEDQGQEEHKDEKSKKKKVKEESAEILKNVVAEKDAEIKSLQERILYLQADFENFKKLKNKERVETLKFGNESLLKELIPVADNLDMAISHASSSEECKGVLEGVKLTRNEFMKVLEKAGITSVEAIGRKFDPNLHEAFYQEERDDLEPDTIISEFQKGYMLNDRLIRPSRVILSKKPEIQ